MLKTLQQLVVVGDQLLAASAQENWDEVAELDRQRKVLLEQWMMLPTEQSIDQEMEVLAGRIRLQDQQLQSSVHKARADVLERLKKIQSGRSANKAYSDQLL